MSSTEKRNQWEIRGDLGEIVGNRMILYEGNEGFEIGTEILERGGARIFGRAYVEGMPELSWENPFQEYPLEDADEISRADALTSLYHAVVEGRPLDYGGENRGLIPSS